MRCSRRALVVAWLVLQLSVTGAQHTVLIAGQNPAQATSWHPGEVCNNSSYDPAKKNFLAALRGKKLRFGFWQIEPPWYSKDPTKSGNAMYSGYNFAMMDRMADLLGVTYDVVELSKIVNGTKMDHTESIPGMLSQVDILGDYSTHTVDRLKSNSFFTPHLDLSGRMVVPKPMAKVPATTDQMFTFLSPFSGGLWCALMSMLCVYGFGIWCMEKDSRRSEDYIGTRTATAAIATSVYYSLALFTGSGGHTPVTKGGRVLSFCLGFSVVVIIAAYTANLAATLTVQPTAIQEIPSLQEAMRQGKKVCSRGKYRVLLETYWPQYKGKFILGGSDWADEQLKTLPTSICDTIIIGQARVDQTLRIDKAYCHLEVVDDPLFPSSGGWATNLQSPCLNAAMDFALQSMTSSGAWSAELATWAPAIKCPVIVTDDEHQDLRVTDMAGLLICNSIIIALVLSAKLFRRVILPHVSTTQSEEAPGPEPGDFGDTAAEVNVGESSGHTAYSDGKTPLLAALQNLLRDYEQDHNDGSDPLLAPLLDKMVKAAFPRYDFDGSGTLNSEEEITQITITVFTKMIQVMPIDKACLNAAVECIEQTYLDRDEFIFTAEEYIAWLLPFLVARDLGAKQVELVRKTALVQSTQEVLGEPSMPSSVTAVCKAQEAADQQAEQPLEGRWHWPAGRPVTPASSHAGPLITSSHA